MDLESTFGTARPVIGMVHLDALPGAPQYEGGFERTLARARADARALDEGGVDAVMVENFGDVPFYPDDVPKHVVASLTRAVTAVSREVDLPVGVNVLRNDGAAAVAVAAAAGGAFVRVNVHTGARVTDQGIVEGRAHETMRLRDRLGADVNLLADVDVKHSAPLAEEPYLAEGLADQTHRGLADAVVASGRGTGEAAELTYLNEIAGRRDDLDVEVPLFVGSGVSPQNVADVLSIADGVIVGTSLKEGGETGNPVSVDRVRELVAAARE